MSALGAVVRKLGCVVVIFGGVVGWVLVFVWFAWLIRVFASEISEVYYQYEIYRRKHLKSHVHNMLCDWEETM